jgi:ornithine cyclodeaminase/alanine dehydrogenase-like protein (mu-crystallin family)
LQQIHANNPTDDAVSTETWSMGMKVVSIRAGNAAAGHPLVPATILHIDPASGVVDAVVAATYLTAAGTAARSALAIQHYFLQYVHTGSNASISSLPPQHVVLFVAGLQAEQHIRFIAGVFDYTIPLVTIINRSLGQAESLQLQLLSMKKPIVDKWKSAYQYLLWQVLWIAYTWYPPTSFASPETMPKDPNAHNFVFLLFVDKYYVDFKNWKGYCKC